MKGGYLYLTKTIIIMFFFFKKNLAKAMKGLSVLGRGLMDGHTVVQARANGILAKAAADQAAGTAVVKKQSGPPAKRAKFGGAAVI